MRVGQIFVVEKVLYLEKKTNSNLFVLCIFFLSASHANSKIKIVPYFKIFGKKLVCRTKHFLKTFNC